MRNLNLQIVGKGGSEMTKWFLERGWPKGITFDHEGSQNFRKFGLSWYMDAPYVDRRARDILNTYIIYYYLIIRIKFELSAIITNFAVNHHISCVDELGLVGESFSEHRRLVTVLQNGQYAALRNKY